MMLRWAAIAVLVCVAVQSGVTPATAGENTPVAEFNSANALYRDGDFTGALAGYETAIAAGIENPDLYYNASNAAFRAGLLGKAILYQERALRLAPSDKDARANLAYLETLRQDVESADDNPLVAMIAGWYGRQLAESFALGSALAFASALILATLALFAAGWRRTAMWISTGALLAVFAVSTGLFAQKLHHDLTVTEAIVLAPEVNVHSGPGVDNTSVFTLHEGTKVAVEQNQDGWNLIRIESGAAGWIPDGVIGVI